MQSGDPFNTLWQPGPTQPLAVSVLQLDVVVVLSPVIPQEQQHAFSLTVGNHRWSDSLPGNPTT